MRLQTLPCPHGHGTAIIRPGQPRPGQPRSRCREPRWAGRPCLRDERAPGHAPAVKAPRVARALQASGMRDTARVLPVSTNTGMTE